MGLKLCLSLLQKVSLDDNSVIVEFIFCFYGDNNRGVVVMVVVGVVIVMVVVIVCILKSFMICTPHQLPFD
jgi:hypothetical protein